MVLSFIELPGGSSSSRDGGDFGSETKEWDLVKIPMNNEGKRL